ncbi:ATP-dependent RecD-like DNA helicase [Fictibacillus aquaticus]|uniref:ATP-dependent RecD2 DNA helicase n=1 Tax=Fictibacillus aquaticus TaxID=2021314 RepID=A0A235F9N4_9BACL|nr:ATP-dependent RecD-like DNA helicase [Fictibacillus aquaticus]OYD58026.1 ATP-dependent RecD-like DNA helicase [Fictibacillus aquaticus]
MNEQPSFLFDEEESSYIRGTFIHNIYYNTETLYTVAKIRVQKTNENYDEKEAVITGLLPPLSQDGPYVFFGKFKEHAKYGKQYEITHFRKEYPKTAEGVIQYLSSDLFKGIGKKTAQQIVEALGENAIELLLERPERLSDVPKLSEDQAKSLYSSLLENQGLEQVMILLHPYGIGPQLSSKIYQTYKEQAVHVLQNEPYRLITDVDGIGFHRADEIGRGLGMGHEHPERIQAACLFVLKETGNDAGHTYLPSDMLLHEVKKLLASGSHSVDEMVIFRELQNMEEEKKLIIKEERVYHPALYHAESGVAKKIAELACDKQYEKAFKKGDFKKTLKETENRLGITYAQSQKQAVHTALHSSVMVLTGGPGTGKTTVIKGIVEMYGELHGVSLNPEDYRQGKVYPIVLVAPTGRAAKRMKESTGIPATTIHRLLGWKGSHFEKNDDEPIEGRLLIIDESSMVDIWLAHALLKAVPKGMQLIFVGDEDQLPSVGPGQVLRDVLSLDFIPKVTLVDIYRQSQDSSIIQLAHSMKHGSVPKDLMEPKKDRRFFSCNAEQAVEGILQVCRGAINKGYKAKDVQVLAPMYRGSAGIDRLNKELQNLFNPDDGRKRKMQFGDHEFRTGDKVLQLINQPEDQIYNGDMGEIVAIFYAKENKEKEDQVVIAFDEVEVTFKRSEFSHFTHAYCCSIHKSQGSEYPIVVLPVLKSYYRMLKRNLIYTAITRSKEYLILCGEGEAFEWAVTRSDDERRYSGLKENLEAAYLAEVEKVSVMKKSI